MNVFENFAVNSNGTNYIVNFAENSNDYPSASREHMHRQKRDAPRLLPVRIFHLSLAGF